jgi:hypothetical protein
MLGGAPAPGARPRPPTSGKQPADGDEISKLVQFLNSQPQPIVCGLAGYSR